MDYKEKLRLAKEALDSGSYDRETIEYIFPELIESEDEKIRKWIIGVLSTYEHDRDLRNAAITWLEKQGSEPNWCHHKVDLSDCSEEYRKAYYDGWNNCNMQHSQCKSELDDVLKCLINGMNFYYEDNKDATWGTDKWSMPVKHIIEVLEKQGEQKPAWSEEEETMITDLSVIVHTYFSEINGIPFKYDLSEDKIRTWLKSLRPQQKLKWSNEEKEALKMAVKALDDLYNLNPLDATYHDCKLSFHEAANIIRSLHSQPKQEWSEEDENYYDAIIAKLEVTQENAALTDNQMDFLKSLKDKVLPKQKWSEEDETHIRYLIECLEHCKKGVALTMTTSTSQEYINWLKSLKPQNRWKPSDEQIEILDMVLTNESMDDNIARILRELREQLKKL